MGNFLKNYLMKSHSIKYILNFFCIQCASMSICGGSSFIMSKNTSLSLHTHLTKTLHTTHSFFQIKLLICNIVSGSKGREPWFTVAEKKFGPHVQFETGHVVGTVALCHGKRRQAAMVARVGGGCFRGFAGWCILQAPPLWSWGVGGMV